MAGTLKKVQFIVAWQTYRVGDIITPNGTLRDFLVAQGYAKVIDTGSVEAPVTRAETSKTKKRGLFGG